MKPIHPEVFIALLSPEHFKVLSKGESCECFSKNMTQSYKKNVIVTDRHWVGGGQVNEVTNKTLL